VDNTVDTWISLVGGLVYPNLRAGRQGNRFVADVSSVGDVPFEISSVGIDERWRVDRIEEEGSVSERISSRDVTISCHEREVVENVVGSDKSAPKLVETGRHDEVMT
jgi:hypothetical protein